MPKILLTNKYPEAPMELVRQALPEGFELLTLERVEKDELVKKVEDADYLLASGRLRIDYEVLVAAKRLKMIQRTGVGTDTLDIEAIKASNIPVFVNRGINARSVAEHTMMMIFAVLRKLPPIHRATAGGIWKKQEFGVQCHELYGKTVGLIGMGSIGTFVAEMLRPFGVKIIYYKRTRLSPKVEKNLGLVYRSFEDLLKNADIISLHCSLNESTQGMINKEAIQLMKKGAILINTSRGQLINEEALVHGLEEGKIQGAGLDVFAQEPVAREHPLLQMENVVVTPHIGGVTKEAFAHMMKEAFENIADFEQGNLEKINDKKLLG